MVQVHATAGDTALGGEEFDRQVVRWMIAEFQRETGVDPTLDRMALSRFKGAAEKAKVELSTAREARIIVPRVAAGRGGSETVRTSETYGELTHALVERTIESCRRCLADARRKPEQIDGVVAMGAAIRARIAQGDVMDVVLLDATPHAVGIETKDGAFAPIIERNRPIPWRNSRVFPMALGHRGRVDVHVLEGESGIAARSESRGGSSLPGSRPPRAEGPRSSSASRSTSTGPSRWSRVTRGRVGGSRSKCIHV
jgi:molecular chaperone DnaK